MKFSEQPPSKQWAALKYKGEKFAEVWFKPADEPFGLMFRIPAQSFQIADAAQRLTTENLLKAVGIGTEEVESWRHEGTSDSGTNSAISELGQPLLPPQNVKHLTVYVSLKPPPQVVAADESAQANESARSGESAQPETPEAKWQDLEGRWRAIAGAEATIDHMRLTMEGLEVQMETTAKATLLTEEKVNAVNADVTAWNKAKTRVHHVMPKLKEFIHRATWVMGTPERKKLEDLFKSEARPDIPLVEMIRLTDQLENLLKDRQVLASQGVTVCQECKNVSTAIQTALTTLRRNAARNADRKRRAAAPKGKFFKHVRKWSGAD
jgi:hypothetical protein